MSTTPNQPNKPVERQLTLTLEAMRRFTPGDALAGLCRHVIHHAVETLRRSGRHGEARLILIGELADLDLAKMGGPALASIAASPALRLVSGSKAS